jgi:hypothetical protein
MTGPPVDRTERVGPVLAVDEAAGAVVAAIQELNQDARVEDRGSYLRVLCPRRCLVTRAAIERKLGRPFVFPGDIERLLLSFKGRLVLTRDEALWTFGRS